uniref:Uncharacterized protein n=1 Tax=viral metagenome TaxID=1070528 RepID=A0A6M3L9D5_9ZZZZ
MELLYFCIKIFLLSYGSALTFSIVVRSVQVVARDAVGVRVSGFSMYFAGLLWSLLYYFEDVWAIIVGN